MLAIVLCCGEYHLSSLTDNSSYSISHVWTDYLQWHAPFLCNEAKDCCSNGSCSVTLVWIELDHNSLKHTNAFPIHIYLLHRCWFAVLRLTWCQSRSKYQVFRTRDFKKKAFGKPDPYWHQDRQPFKILKLESLSFTNEFKVFKRCNILGEYVHQQITKLPQLQT